MDGSTGVMRGDARYGDEFGIFGRGKMRVAALCGIYTRGIPEVGDEGLDRSVVGVNTVK